MFGFLTWEMVWVSFASYLVGSIPFGLIIGKLFKGVDVRKQGTGNIGASNVALVAGPLAGLWVVVGDALKGMVAVSLARLLLGGGTAWPIAIAALCAILGHDFSVFLKFQGGKGVATLGGVLLALDIQLALSAILLWLLFALLVKYMTGSTLLVLTLLPLLMWIFFAEPAYVALAAVNALIAFVRHRDNLRRIFRGEEPTLSLLGKFFARRTV